MTRARTSAIALLIVTALGGFVVAPVLLTTHDHRPPAFVPVVLILCALASVAAAFGLRRRASWAVALGIGARTVAVLLAIPAFFSGVHTGPLVGAAVAIALSLITIVSLVSVHREQTSSLDRPHPALS